MNTRGIVICQINSKYIHSSLAPWCLLAGIRKYSASGIKAAVIEGTVNENADRITERILEQKPMLVGFCTYIWNLSTVEHVAREVKRAMPECIIALGGPQAGFTQRELLEKWDFVDFILSGEGEYPFAKLAESIITGTDIQPEELGISYRHDGETVVTEPYLPDDIPPSPYTDEYFAALNGRIAYIETSRGCPFSCAFCLSGKCGKLRFYPEERARKEILALANSGAKTIKFVDRTFNADRRRADSIWSFIAENYGSKIPNGVRFHFEIAAKLVDEKSMEVIRTLPRGAVQFEIGIQSFNPKTLAAINRDTDTKSVERVVRELLSFGNTHIHTDLIAGLPFEDYSSFRDSFNASFAMRPHMLQLGFLKVLSGSEMGGDSYKYKCEHSQVPPFEVISTDFITSAELDKLRKTEELLERMYNSGRFISTLGYVLEATGLTPFDLFEILSQSMDIPHGMSLDDFTAELVKALSELVGIDPDRLFDAILVDRISTNPDGRLPRFLKHDSVRNSLFKKQLNREYPDMFKSGVRHCFSVLKAENAGVFARYDIPADPITGRFEIKKVKLDLYEM